MRVLIVDDDATSRVVLSAVVKRLGHEAVTAKNGRDALEAHERFPAPVIVSDWVMPEMTGVELCRAVRAVRSSTYTYFIIVTSLSSRESSLEGFAAGADDFLAKPINPDELAARLAAAERVVQRHLSDNERHLRDAIELSQQGARLTRDEDSSAGDQIAEKLGQLVDVYRAQDAFVKARAFLRRQIALEEERAAPPERIDRLRAELAELTRRERPNPSAEKPGDEKP